MDKYQALKKYYGYDSFRPGQEELIDAIISGRDVIGILPTGSGKSVCYQIPAVLMRGVTIVISPLISLMNDQVANLKKHGIGAAAIYGMLSSAKYDFIYNNLKKGKYKLVYVAPERLKSERFLRFCRDSYIAMVVIDEAHCVSQWGKDFRPEYLHIKDFISSFPERPITAAFTASATPYERTEIGNLLGLNDPVRVITGFDRPNLYFDVVKTRKKEEKLLELLKSIGGSKIVYCSTRRQTDEVCGFLASCGLNAGAYHAGIGSDERSSARENFISGKTEIIVATNAFGMGIDKPDVRAVVHFSMPGDIESYYQQAGRAGRDGKPSVCIILYSDSDREVHEFLISKSAGENTQNSQNAENRMRELEYMQTYCLTDGCRRKYMMEYFGEEADDCGYCGNCLRAGGKRAELPSITPATAEREFSRDYLNELKLARKKAAKKHHIPKHLLISDAQLRKIVKLRPLTVDELMNKCDVSYFQFYRIGMDIIDISNKYK